MVVYYEGWRTVILKSVETNQLIRVFLEEETYLQAFTSFTGPWKDSNIL